MYLQDLHLIEFLTCQHDLLRWTLTRKESLVDTCTCAIQDLCNFCAGDTALVHVEEGVQFVLRPIAVARFVGLRAR